MTEIRNFNSKMGDLLIFDNWTEATIFTEKSEEKNEERLAQVEHEPDIENSDDSAHHEEQELDTSENTSPDQTLYLHESISFGSDDTVGESGYDEQDIQDEERYCCP